VSRCLFIGVLLQAWALAGVRVTPGPVTVAAGSTCAFRATLDGTQPPGGWRWSVLDGPGTIDEATGLYQAPDGSAARARVQAALRTDLRRAGQAAITVLPLPAGLPGLIGATLGEPWVMPYASSLPFLDPETGTRPVPGDRIIPTYPLPGPGTTWLVGYGVPVAFNPTPAEPVDGLRLAYREGHQWHRRDLDCAWTELVFRDRVASLSVEALKRSVQQPGKWRSTVRPSRVDVRGALPFCGNAVAPGGHEDGAGLAARFMRPFGLVSLGGEPGTPEGLLLVSDPKSHVLRTVDAEGGVATLGGLPGQAGHRDSPTLMARVEAVFAGPKPQPPLFHSPTHLAVRRCTSDFNPFAVPWEEAVVADSGNHVIRTVRADGRVGTLAGMPGYAGYRDADAPGQAAFNDPQGLAVDAAGRVYVADRGNRAIRVIHPSGAVTTLTSAQAGFSDLQGLCLYPPLGGLLVLDGHAVRLVQLPSGEVSTLMGVVDVPGFRDIGRGESAAQPCLNHPTGIARCGAGLAIADHGNHAVRIASPGCLTLATAAGDPDQGAIRWGLIRDGLPGPLDDEYATLEGPWTVVSRFERAEGQYGSEVFVTTGRCLAAIHHDAGGRAPLEFVPIGFLSPEAAVAETFVLRFRVGNAFQAIHYTADFLDPDGKRQVRVQGVAAGGETLPVQGHFSQAGTGTVRIRGVSDQGVSRSFDLKVLVR